MMPHWPSSYITVIDETSNTNAYDVDIDWTTTAGTAVQDWYSAIPRWKSSNYARKNVDWKVTDVTYFDRFRENLTTFNDSARYFQQGLYDMTAAWRNLNHTYTGSSVVWHPGGTVNEPSEKEKKQKKLAVKRGRALLLSVLSDDQALQYAKTGQFLVQGSNGSWFRVRKNRTVELVDIRTGKCLACFCVHPAGRYVSEDTLIAQKMMIEANLPEFERLANITMYVNPIEDNEFPDNVVDLKRYRKMQTTGQFVPHQAGIIAA